MLMEPLRQLLNKLKLTGMLGAFERQLSDPDAGALRFEERLAMLLQHELAERENYPLQSTAADRRAPATGVLGGSGHSHTHPTSRSGHDQHRA